MTATQHSANFSSGFGLTGLTVKFTELEIGTTISICSDIIFNIYKRKYTAKYRVQKYYLKNTILICFISMYLQPFLLLLDKKKKHLYNN